MAKTRVGIRNGALFNQTSTLWNNLLAYYTGDGTPDDALGNYNGTLVNGTTYGTGIINQGFSFDGVNDYVNLPSNALDLNGDFTMSLWFNSDVNNNYYVLLSSYVNGGYGVKIDLRNTNQIRCVVYNVGTISLLSNTTFIPGNWYHVVFTRKSGVGSKMYINGVLDNSDTNTVDPRFNTTLYPTLGVSRYSVSGFEQYYNGLLDEVGVWDRELTASEVTELYNSGNGKQYTPPAVSTPSIITDGLVLNLDAGNTSSYPGTGTDWFDLTSNGNDGVLVNGASYVTDGGGSISFDGVNDYVSFSTITNNIYTIDFWYKMDANDGSYGYFVSSGYNGLAISEGGGFNGLSFGKFYYWNGSANILSDIPSTTDWNHICVVINTTTNNLQLFGNGVQLNNVTISNMSTSVSNIGRFITSNTHFLKGNLASYKIYNKALTDSEVLQNYNATKGRFGL